jgi:hypothetical protein
MLEIQPYRLIGQSLRQGVQYLIDTEQTCYFLHTCSSETPSLITVSLRPTTTAKRLLLKHQIPLIDYLLIEVLHHYVFHSLSKVRSPITSSEPSLVESVWQHILTHSVLKKCSPLILSTSTTNSPISSIIKDFEFWSDETACKTLQRFIDISIQCTNEGSDSIDYAHANEYLVSVLQKMATTNILFSN